MAQVYSIDGVAVNNRIRTTASPSGVEGLPASAWYGEAMIAGVTVDDPEGELDLHGWHTFTHDETDCTGAERTFTGWITGKDIMRGDNRERTGAARIWVCEIIDQNAVWKLKLFRAASAQRPAESDIERMDFMRQSAPMAATPVADNGRWNVTDNPVNFGAASYVAQYPIDLANSVAGVSGKNFYAYWDDAAGEISGHYDLVTENPLSTIAISNVIADHDSTTVYPLLDAVLTRSPEDQVNGVLYQYIGNQYVYAQDPDLFGPGEFSPDNFDRDVLYSTDRVGRLSTATSQAAAQLAARSTEQDTLTVTVLLPPAQVNLLHAGMRVASKFSHLPGYEDFVDLAVIRRNVIPPVVVGGDYTVRLELSNRVAPSGPGGGDPGDFPPINECAGLRLEGGIYQSIHGAGQAMAGTIDVPAGITGNISWRVVGNAYYGFDGWPAGGTGGTNYILISGTGGAGTETIPDTGTPTLNPGGALTPFDITGGFDSGSSANLKGHTLSFSLQNGDNRESWYMDLTYLELWGTTDPNYPEEGECTPDPEEVPVCPEPGQWTQWFLFAEGDGSTSQFTLDCPYADGGLLVKVDGLDVAIGLTETDPAAGVFDLDFAPKAAQGDAPAEQVWIKYQGR